ncbi:MAG: sigma-54-dependent Fis family transcriptional regulator [Bacteroidales bacterium]|nr:sigma-54-dependent Fis family transcriptional regulator [Bacteroidales bacterium]
MSKVLIIDDEPAIRRAMRSILENEGYTIADAASAIEALPMLNNNVFDAIFCDIKMPQMDGIEFLEKAQTITDAPIIIISGHGTIDIAVDAIKKGAYDFIEKPMDLNRMLITLRNALDKNRLVNETKKLRNVVSKQYEMIGDSWAMNELYTMIERVAPTNARVLILGENGTGKELVARQLHDRSPRKDNPFIEVNCAAIPSELIESQLFGHEKGAFTSAIKQKKGSFELADNGTLFLDEIGDMSLAAQAKVLRALQENKITRVGGEEEIKVDVRVIAATNKNLQEEIAKGNFREDLYHRISMIIMRVPPLRERLDDIPLLINSFVVKAANEMGKPIPTFTQNAIEELKRQNWSGNIRELQNVVGRLVILCGSTISEEDVKKYL